MGTLRHLVRCGLAACLVVVPARGARGQSLPAGCNAGLAAAKARTADDYKVRGAKTQWCEGIYTRKVGNRRLALDGMTVPASPVDAKSLKKLDSLVVQWVAPPGTVVHVAAHQVVDPSKPDYQLDAQLATPANGVGRWAWPTTLLQRFGLWPLSTLNAGGGAERVTLAVAGSALLPSGRPTDSMYIPVRIASPADTAVDRSHLEMLMIADERVELRKITLSRWLSESSTKEIAMADKCLQPNNPKIGNAPVRIRVCMPANAEPGIYLLTIGSAQPTSVRFYWAPGPQPTKQVRR